MKSTTSGWNIAKKVLIIGAWLWYIWGFEDNKVMEWSLSVIGIIAVCLVLNWLIDNWKEA